MRTTTTFYALTVFLLLSTSLRADPIKWPDTFLPDAEKRFVIPAQKGAGGLFIAAKVNEQEIPCLLVDTGSFQMLMDSSLCSRLKLGGGQKSPTNAPSGLLDMSTSKIRSFSVGDVTMSEQDIIDFNMGAFTHELGFKPNGIIGTILLAQLPFTYDYGTSQIIFYHPKYFEPPSGALKTSLRQGASSMMGIDVLFHDKTTACIQLDTGMLGDAFSVNSQFYQQHRHLFSNKALLLTGTVDVLGSHHSVCTEICSVKVFGKHLRHVKTIVRKGNPNIQNDFEGSFGCSVWKDFRLTIDYQNKSIWTELCQVETPESALASGHLNVSDLSGSTPFIRMVSKANTRQLDAMLKAGADINLKTKRDFTALMAAAHEGLSDSIRILLKHGAHVDDIDSEGLSALSYAKMRHHSSAAKVLLNNGANPNCKFYGNLTELMIAIEARDPVGVKHLLDKGADLKAQNKWGDTAWTVAALLNSDPEMIDLLLKRGAGLESQNKEGQTALAVALEFGHKELAALLRQKGAKEPEKTVPGKP